MLSREKVNKGTKVMNSLLSSPLVIPSILRDFTGKTTAYKSCVKARLHRRFLSRQLDAIFVAPTLHQVSNMFETPAMSRRQIALGLHV